MLTLHIPGYNCLYREIPVVCLLTNEVKRGSASFKLSFNSLEALCIGDISDGACTFVILDLPDDSAGWFCASATSFLNASWVWRSTTGPNFLPSPHAPKNTSAANSQFCQSLGVYRPAACAGRLRLRSGSRVRANWGNTLSGLTQIIQKKYKQDLQNIWLSRASRQGPLQFRDHARQGRHTTRQDSSGCPSCQALGIHLVHKIGGSFAEIINTEHSYQPLSVERYSRHSFEAKCSQPCFPISNTESAFCAPAQK